MAKKIGIVLALDGEPKFTQGMKNAQQSAKLCNQELKNLKEEYKDNANTLEALTRKQEQLTSRQEAFDRVLAAAKEGRRNAVENYKKIGERLESLRGSLEKAEKSLADLEKAGETSSRAYRSQAANVENLKSAIEKQTAEQLKASANITRWDTAISKANGDITKSNKEIEQNAKYLDEAGRSADQCAVSIDKMGRETEEAGAQVSKLGIGFKETFNLVASNVITNALGLLKDSVTDAAKFVIDVGSTFEASMSEVAAISGATASQLDQISAKAKALGSTTKFSASEVAQGFKYMSLAGWDTEAMLSSIDGVINLAAAGQMDLAEASDMVTDYLSAFGLSAEYAGKMADEMAYAQANSNTSARQLGEAYSNCAANLHAAGQDMETTTAILEAMANQGTKGAEAGTALSAMMRDISQKAKDGSIMIGDTAVAIQDANGDFRDLTDILKDVEKATRGMGTADRDAALRKTFTARSVKAVNEVLTEGVDAISEYEEALRSSDGAAADMAATMQDNFVGATTRLKSATEGLGVAIFETVQKPLTSLVNFGADVVGGLAEHFQGMADALNPAKTELEEFLDLVAQNNESALKSLETSGGTITGMTQEVGDLERYKTVLLSLNEQENLNELQKYQLKAAVDALSLSIPELADAYDGTTGKVKLEREEIEKLIETRQKEVIETAKTMAQQEALQALYSSQLAAAQAESAKSATQAELDALNEQKQAIEDAARAIQDIQLNSANGMTAEQLSAYKEAEAVLESYGYSAGVAENILRDFESACDDLNSEIETQSGNLKKADKELEQANLTASEATTAYEGIAENAEQAAQSTMEVVRRVTEEQMARQNNAAAADKEAGSKENSADASTVAAEAESDYADSQEDAAESSEEAAKAAEISAAARKEAAALVDEAYHREEKSADELQKELEELIETGAEEAEIQQKVAEVVKARAEEEAAAARAAEEANKRLEESAKRLEHAQTDSAENIKAAWASLKEEAKKSLSFSLFDGFNGGQDQTTETMNKNLDDQLAGFQNYADNLEKLSGYIGDTISPEFAQYIEGMGMDGANTLQHIIWTLENQGEYGIDQVKGLSDKYTQAMNWEDSIASTLAGDKAALSDGLKAMGSTDEEFQDLQKSMAAGFAGADEAALTSIRDLADTAKDVGATIPEGLTDAIKNGDIDASEVQTELSAVIQSALTGLLEIAEEEGGNVPEELAKSILAGEAAPQEAYNELISSISDKADSSTEDTDAGTDLATTVADNITASQEAVVEAVTAVTDAAKEAFTTAAEDFKTAGSDAVAGFIEGLSDESTLESLKSAGTAIANGIAGGITDEAGSEALENAGSRISGKIISGVAKNIESLTNLGNAVASKIASGITDETGAEALQAAGSQLPGKISSGIARNIEGLTNLGGAIASKIASGVGDETAAGYLQTAGGNIAGDIKTGIDTKKDNYTGYGKSIVGHIIDGVNDEESVTAMQGTGEAIGTAFTNGIRENQEAFSGIGHAVVGQVMAGLTDETSVETATSAGNTLGMSVFSGLGEVYHTYFTATGTAMANAVTNAVSAEERLTEAKDAGQLLAINGVKGASGTLSLWSTVGANMSSGLAHGIARGSASAIAAAVSVATRALNAAKNALGIKSPSRKFRDEVGKQIVAGMAFGIRQNTSLTVAAANTMSARTLAAATAWLGNYSKSHKVTKQEEAYFWGQLAATAEKGTASYEKILDRASSAAAASNFGVSWTKVTGSGKKKKKTKKTIEEFYSDVWSAAQEYYDMLTMNQDMSIKDQLSYWRKVQASLRKGTKAYQDACEKIKAIQEEIGGYNVASDLLDSIQVYTELSEKALMQYWDIVRKQYKEGTEERLRADEQYLKARTKYNDKLKSLEDDYSNKVEEVNRKYTDALDDRTKAIADAFDMFDAFESESETGEQLLFNMQSQAAGYRYWMEQLEALKNRGILSNDIIDNLTEKGPQETAAIYALNSLSDDQLAEYNKAYQTKMDLARAQATKDEKDLAAATEAELESLRAEYSSSVAEVNTNLNAQITSLAGQIRTIAGDQTAQIVAALNKGQTAGQAIAAANTPAATPAAATASSAVAADPVLAAINSASNRSKTVSAKEKKEHADLWIYLAQKYGKKGSNKLYTKLASALGVKVSSTVTSAQKNKILKKLKEKGYRSGTRRIASTGIWMDEDGPGSEMAISRADGAIWTRVPTDAAITPANLTTNLWKWGSLSPDEYALTNMAYYNKALENGFRMQIQSTDRSAVLMEQMLGLMSEFLPLLQNRTELSIDGRKLVSATSDYTSNDMAMRVRRRRA